MKRSRFLLASSLVQFALLIPLAMWTRKHPQPLREVMLTRFAQKKQTSRTRTAVTFLNTLTGSSVVLNVLVVPIAALLWRMRLQREAITILVSCWSQALVETVLKRVIYRPRPSAVLVHVKHQSRGKSFPSGHVATSVCLWGWIGTLSTLSKNRSPLARGVLFSISTAIVAFTGPARVYLGDHWATDVLGGYLFGGGWFCLSLNLYQQLWGE